MTLFVHRSNRLERLAAQLARVVAPPLADPFARECIVVQGPGMERWLSTSLSRVLGVWANPWFPFPRALIELYLEHVLGPLDPAENTFVPDALLWRVAEQLRTRIDEPAFAEVAGYLRDDHDDARLIDLARRLAETFDQYVVYRPDQMLDWERGNEAHFQAELVRGLVREGGRHLAHRMRELARALDAGASLTGGALPERISLFGISTLPPAFLAVIAQIAQHVDVHLFLLAPSREYWGDLDRREQRRPDLHGFLAQLGKLSREFADALELHGYQEIDDLFEEPEPDSMLRALQGDLVSLTARARRGDADDPLHEPPLAIDESDDSVRVHVCHSAVRELEVLRDQLRARFEADATLAPRDVVVFAPDIERYAPAIEAVFAEGTARDGTAIPYRIADRRTVRASEIAEAFFVLLELLGSRLHLSDVLDFLHRPAVRERFDIAEAELDRAQHWLVTAGARWAVDATHRAGFGQPACAANSLRFALDRLLVGYAAQADEQRELFDVLPCSEVEGRDAILLGKLARYLETLFAWVDRLAAPAPPAEHARALSRLLGDALSDAGDRGIEHHALRATLSDLAAEAERASFTRPVRLASIARLLERRLDRGRANVGFLAGGITFCEPVPMRAIPFRVVCLLGMDDESFPRSVARPAFDLMAASPRAGDRSLRDDDRQLFLEAVLSARDALHVSYVGRSAQDAAERPASVLVDQLRRLCDQHFVFSDAGHTLSLELEGTVSKALTYEHALHRFDPRYFQRGASPLSFSYDERAAEAARALRTQKRALPAFVPAPLTVGMPEGPLELTLEALQRFLRKPQEVFLQERLKLYLPRELDDVADREPIVLDALERFRIADDLLAQRDSLPREERARLLTKAGKLAPGSVGRAQLEVLETLIDGVVDACPKGEPRADRVFDLQLASGRLSGRLSGLCADARVVRSVGALHLKRKLGVFVEHVVLCATGAEPTTTLLVGRDGKTSAQTVTFAPLEPHDAEQLLTHFLRLYRVGLCMPLPLLHDASDAYLRERAKGADERTAIARAQLKLVPGRLQPGAAADDPHVREVWSEEQLADLGHLWASDGALTVRFADVAEQVLGPLLRYGERARGDGA
ncbi:MAG: exodeoxyribonuclease V subunit gamma [Polyangiales bacterium]